MALRVRASEETASPAVVLYPVHKKELVQMRIAFTVRWLRRSALLREIRFYCQYAEVTFQISSDGGWWQSRHVLTAQGDTVQIEELVRVMEQLFARPGLVAEGTLVSI